MSGKLVIGIIILVILLGGGYLVLKSSSNSTPPVSNTQQSSTNAPLATTEITVEGNEFAFNPSTITVKKGQTVKITFKNTGKYPHNFTLSQLNVRTQTIQPGQQDTVQFTADKAGSFTYICTVPGHADRGMKGILTVQ